MWSRCTGDAAQLCQADQKGGRDAASRRSSPPRRRTAFIHHRKECGNRPKIGKPLGRAGPIALDAARLACKLKHCPRGATFPDGGGDHAPFSIVVVFRRRVIRHYLFRRIKCLGPHGLRRSTVCASSRNGLFVGKADSALHVRSCGLQVRVVLGPCQRRPRGLLSALDPNPTLKLW